MVERRPLTAGLVATPIPTDTSKEKDFVYNGARPAKPPAPATMGRSPLSTRVREDFAKALKRASLERQLSGVEPSTLQDILEEALEPWLKANGYLP